MEVYLEMMHAVIIIRPPTPRSVLIFYSVQEIRTFWNFVTKEIMLSR